MTLAGIALIVKPELILDFITRHAKSQALFATAIVMRLVLGLLLITLAGLSRFPLTVTVFGWITVIAAVTFAWIGHDRFTRLILWITAKVDPFGRIGGILGVLFGLFLLYAFL
jgi:hypothetical protein